MSLNDAAYCTTVIEKIKAYCDRKGIKTTGVLMCVIQRNRSTDFSSLVINFNTSKIEQGYLKPYERNTTIQVEGGKWLFTYSDNLADLSARNIALGGSGEISVPECDRAQMFCCDKMVPYMPRTLELEGLFTDFVSGKGHHPNLVYRVENKPDMANKTETWTWVKHFQMINGHRVPIEGEFKQKKHAFKNFKCPVHLRFLTIDLYDAKNTVGANFHHMRPIPYTQINRNVLDEFFQDVHV
jgi:hypothetical protein